MSDKWAISFGSQQISTFELASPSCSCSDPIYRKTDATGPEGTCIRCGFLNRLATDQRTVAERKWQAGMKPRKEQKPMDIGLWSDDANQLDLVEMFQQPTNEE